MVGSSAGTDVATIWEDKVDVQSLVMKPIRPVVVGVIGDRGGVRGSVDGVTPEQVDRIWLRQVILEDIGD